MIKRAVGSASQETSCGQSLLPRARRRLQRLLGCGALAVSLAAGATSSAQGINGDPTDGEGLFGPPTPCDFEVVRYCNDSFDPGIPSCHQRFESARDGVIDEGLAMKVCTEDEAHLHDGRIARNGLFELEVPINSTDFGSVFCGQDADGDDFCFVCQTVVEAGSGGRRGSPGGGRHRCVKIENVGMTVPDGMCGAFAVRTDAALCEVELDGLEDTFRQPGLGFLTQTNGDQAGQLASTGLVVCGGRSWQCIDNPAALAPFAAEVAVQLRSPAIGAINTPHCYPCGTGCSYCK